MSENGFNVSPFEIALVSHKDKIFKVKSLLEVYDPDTGTILQFSNSFVPYPWGGPDKVDVARLMNGRR